MGVFNQTASWGTDLTLIRKSSANVPKAIYDAADWDVQSKDYIENLGATYLCSNRRCNWVTLFRVAIYSGNKQQGFDRFANFDNLLLYS